ncbi:MAG: 1-acyl-sn-glycerol-3-phosphate acyltransferase, partial [Kiritimatiellota bacterium]|nr:1-acyl-sn-glycerol-3-phosphate acyltransferase [Kiritimatiellota bacterium]
ALAGSRTGLLRWLLGPLFYLPAHHFAHIFARLDNEVPYSGLSGGARLVLPDFSLHVNSRGAEFIPASGPLLVVSNHPGAYDSLAITASIPRKDVKIVVSDVKFVHSLRAASQYFIYVPPETAGRMAVLRSAIQHLKNGGALLIFAHGEVEPDPAVSPGASQSIQDWSPSVEIMLRKVPDAWLQIVIASHMLLPQFFNSPIARLRRQPHTRQKLAEVTQVIQQMLFPKSIESNVRL